MKINGKLNRILTDEKGFSEVTFTISNYQHQKWITELEKEPDYAITIKKVKSQRSLSQNAYFWKLLHELEKVSKQDFMIWYCHLLEETNCKFEYLVGIDGLESYLLNSFRAVRKIGKRVVDGKEVMGYRCYVGSSKYTIKEMQELIEVLLRYCAEYNIQIDKYE